MQHFRKINTLKPFDWFLIIGIVALNIIYSVLLREIDFIGSVAAVSGVICVVMVARGNILNYIFGLVNVALYAYISFKSELYGDAVLNAVYYVPMQFVGWFNWIKNREAKDSVTVTSKTMNTSQRIILIVFSVAMVAIVGFILDKLEDPQPYKDSATTVLSVIAMYLMVRTYVEQWSLWVVVNVISVIMWIVAFLRGDAHSMLMVIMWIFYLANSLNGWYTWIHLSSKK
ncbi:MAG: nicotinamide riboside transporter PnuC [Bacteroidales bacterium]|jgi:nicotinamide mononucleotide transporter